MARLASTRNRLKIITIAAILVFLPNVAWPRATIKGSVEDIFHRPVSGAKVSVTHEGLPLVEGFADAAGRFNVVISFGDFGTLDLTAEHPNYSANSMKVEIISFEPEEDSYDLTLMPSSLVPCLGVPGAVIVGKFLPPPSAPTSDLTAHVHRVLQFRILPELQAKQLKSHLDPGVQHLVPQILKCETVSPLSDAESKPIAAALEAQGLVWGAVAPAAHRYDVETSITDPLDAYKFPFTTTSRGVDLSRPREAVISPVTRAAILISIMATLKHAGQCKAAIYVNSVVVRLINSPTIDNDSSVADLRRLGEMARELTGHCKRRIPNAGLMADTGP